MQEITQTTLKICSELSAYKDLPKSQLLINSIRMRLDKCLAEYYNQLIKSFDRLAEYKSLNLLKKINKE